MGIQVLAKVPLINRVFVEPEFGVADHGWGYVLRSPHPEQTLPKGWLAVVWGLCLAALFAVWIIGRGAPIWAPALSLCLLAGTYIGLRWLTAVQAFEMRVDGRRREVRMGRVMPSGRVWFEICAGFEEVEEVRIRAEGEGVYSLWIWIAGEEAPIAFARGAEDALLAFHDRLLGDVRARATPRSGSGRDGGAMPGARRRRRPFPPLTPREVA